MIDAVFLLCSNLYVDLAAIALRSLNQNIDTAVSIYILSNNLTWPNKNKLSKSWDTEVDFIEVSKIINELDLDGVPLCDGLSKTTLARIFAPTMLPESEHVALCLDSDTLVVGDLNSMFHEDYSRYSIYGICELMNPGHLKDIGMAPGDKYINAGVMVMNLDRLRELGFVEKARRVLSQNPKSMLFRDQDVINILCTGEKGLLPIEYNMITPFFLFSYKSYISFMGSSSPFYSKDDYESGRANPKIIHFTSGFEYARPWNVGKSHHPYAKLYREHMYRLSIEPFGDDHRTLKHKVASRLIDKGSGWVQRLVVEVKHRIDHHKRKAIL